MKSAQAQKPRTLIDRVSDALDRAILAIAPARGMRRIAARELWRAHQERAVRNRGLDSNSTGDTRGDRWLGSRLSARDVEEEDLESARHNSRELFRTDSIGGSVDSRVNHVVGATLTIQARVPNDRDIPNADGLNRDIEGVLEDWMPAVDVDGTRSLWQTVRLIERCHAVDGEAFIVLSDLGSADKPIPLAVEVIDSDRVMTPPAQANNPRIRLGIERDAKNRIVAYWVRRESPFDSRTTDVSYERVPTARVLHLFEPWFAEATRGLPWMVRIQNRVKDIRDLDEANLIAMQVEASFAAFVETTGGNPMETAIAAASGASNGKRLQDVVPGSVAYLNRGEQIKFANPNRSGGNYAQSLKFNYHRVAAGMNESYEGVLRDWEGVSFAGGRIILSEKKISSGVWRRLLFERVLRPIYHRAVTEMVIVGALPLDPREFNRRRSLYLRHQWMGPGWPYAINPVDEVQADINAVRENFKTRAEVIAERTGQDIEAVDRERQRERRRERELEIVPPELAAAEAATASTDAQLEAATA